MEEVRAKARIRRFMQKAELPWAETFSEHAHEEGDGDEDEADFYEELSANEQIVGGKVQFSYQSPSRSTTVRGGRQSSRVAVGEEAKRAGASFWEEQGGGGRVEGKGRLTRHNMSDSNVNTYEVGFEDGIREAEREFARANYVQAIRELNESTRGETSTTVLNRSGGSHTSSSHAKTPKGDMYDEMAGELLNVSEFLKSKSAALAEREQALAEREGQMQSFMLNSTEAGRLSPIQMPNASTTTTKSSSLGQTSREAQELQAQLDAERKRTEQLSRAVSELSMQVATTNLSQQVLAAQQQQRSLGGRKKSGKGKGKGKGKRSVSSNSSGKRGGRRGGSGKALRSTLRDLEELRAKDKPHDTISDILQDQTRHTIAEYIETLNMAGDDGESEEDGYSLGSGERVNTAPSQLSVAVDESSAAHMVSGLVLSLLNIIADGSETSRGTRFGSSVLSSSSSSSSSSGSSVQPLRYDNSGYALQCLPGIALVMRNMDDYSGSQQVFLEFAWSVMRNFHDDNGAMKTTIERILRRLYKGNHGSFVNSDQQVVRTLSCLILSKFSTDMDVLGEVLDILREDLGDHEVKQLFLLQYHGVSVLTPLLGSARLRKNASRSRKSATLLLRVARVFLSLTVQSGFFKAFLSQCSNESWFAAATSAMMSGLTEVQECLAVLLKHLSKIPANAILFDIACVSGGPSLRTLLMDLQHHKPNRDLLVANIAAIFRNLE